MTFPDTPEKARQELDKLNIQWHGDKFLSLVLTGEADLVKLFLIAGMSTETADKNGITALMWGAGRGHAEIVRLLLEHGAKVNSQTAKGKTPLMSAAYYGKAETLKILIDHGADRNLKDSENKTASDWARERKQTAISAIL
jgi:ankyrin repeat protein